MRRRWLGLAVGALALLVVSPTPASAGGDREDVAFDAIAAKGDVLASTYSANFTDIFLTHLKVRVTTRQGSNPVTSPAWHNTNTELRAFLDVTSTHGGPDFLVTLGTPQEGPPFTFVAEVTSLLGGTPAPVECGATATITEPNIFKANIPSDCWAPLDVIRVRERVALVWDPPPAGGTQGTDKAPDVGWGPFLQAPPPPP